MPKRIFFFLVLCLQWNCKDSMDKVISLVDDQVSAFLVIWSNIETIYYLTLLFCGCDEYQLHRKRDWCARFCVAKLCDVTRAEVAKYKFFLFFLKLKNMRQKWYFVAKIVTIVQRFVGSFATIFSFTTKKNLSQFSVFRGKSK